MFIQIVTETKPTRVIAINTDNVNFIKQTDNGCDFNMTDGTVVRTEADYENVQEMLASYERKQRVMCLNTDTIKVKVVNPH